MLRQKAMEKGSADDFTLGMLHLTRLLMTLNKVTNDT